MTFPLGSITGLDRHALSWVVDHRVSFLNPIAEGITYLGTGGTIWVVAAALLAWRTQRPIIAIAALAGVCVWGSDGISHLLKVVTDRPRPFVTMPHLHVLVSRPASNDFPSSHATTAFAGAVVLSYLRPRLWPAFVIAAAAIAYSRLYVGVHYPTDVLAGAAVGAAFAAAVIALVARTSLNERLATRRRRAVAWF